MTIDDVSMINIEIIKFLLVFAVEPHFSKFKNVCLVQIQDLQRSTFVRLVHFWFGYSQEVDI